MKPFLKLSICVIVGSVLSACSDNRTTQIGDNTFVHKSKVYRIVDNEINEIGDLDKQIRKFEIAKPFKTNYGTSALDYVKPSAYTSLNALYRGNTLYYTLTIYGINDLRENYTYGRFIISFTDEYGFILHSTEVLTTDLTGMLDDNKQIIQFEYNGKTKMSSESNKAIKGYGKRNH